MIDEIYNLYLNRIMLYIRKKERDTEQKKRRYTSSLISLYIYILKDNRIKGNAVKDSIKKGACA